MEKWVYESAGQKRPGMPYWTLPDSALDGPEEASALAQEALAISHRAGATIPWPRPTP